MTLSNVRRLKALVSTASRSSLVPLAASPTCTADTEPQKQGTNTLAAATAAATKTVATTTTTTELLCRDPPFLLPLDFDPMVPLDVRLIAAQPPSAPLTRRGCSPNAAVLELHALSLGGGAAAPTTYSASSLLLLVPTTTTPWRPSSSALCCLPEVARGAGGAGGRAGWREGGSKGKRAGKGSSKQRGSVERRL